MECELLPGLEDPILENLRVIDVEVKSMACIQVIIGPGSAQPLQEACEVEEALARIENRLRMELSGSIRMKRMPLLRLRYVPLPPWAKQGGAE